MASVKLSNQNFGNEVLKSDLPVIVDFWADWCGPCRMMAPVFEELSEEFKGKVKFAKLNVDENPELSEKYEIRSLPSLVVFKNGKEQDIIIGFYPKPALKEVIGKYAK